MISDGCYHEQVPRDAGGNLRYRRRVLAEARESADARTALKEMCGRDILFYVNTFGWQYNPSKMGDEVGPFVTWPFQEAAIREILECVETGEDAVIEKSREMGASWMCLFVAEWLWHFKPATKGLVISRNADAVDKPEDPDSLFWKIDFVHRRLPGWLMPAGFDPASHRMRMTFVNPENGSAITGQASTGKAGVGGRATWMLIDEFSQIKEDYEVLQRTSDTTPCRVFNGTHLGLGTAFCELTRRVDMRKIRMHWTEHPDKVKGLYRYDAKKKAVEVLDKTYPYPPGFRFVTDGTPVGGPRPGVRSPWYDEQCERKGSMRAVAMDLDIDPGGTTNQFYDAILVRHLQAEYARPPVWRGSLTYSEDATPGEFAAGDSGKLLLWRPLSIGGGPHAARYAVGVDAGEGKGATPSCLSVVDADTGEKVGEYADALIDPRVLGKLAVALCRVFADGAGTPAKLAWEMQGPGTDFGGEVLALGFRHIHYRRDDFKLNQKTSDKPGWYPSGASKRVLHGNYRDALRLRQCENPSHRALEETLGFEETRDGVEHDGFPVKDDPSGAGVCHGDRVVADALAWMMKLSIAPPAGARGRQPAAPAGPPNPLSLLGRRTLSEAAERDRNEF